MDTPLFTLAPSQPRLWFTVFSLGALGAAMLWIALAHPPAGLGWRVLFLLAGGGILWGAISLLRLRDRSLVLTAEALVDSRAGVICRLDEVEAIGRGAFAAKPARGFSLQLAHPAERRWVPGLWWRIGRSVGVGGMTGAGQTRVMADIIEARLAMRKTG
jgi:hypothetical protein